MFASSRQAKTSRWTPDWLLLETSASISPTSFTISRRSFDCGFVTFPTLSSLDDVPHETAFLHVSYEIVRVLLLEKLSSVFVHVPRAVSSLSPVPRLSPGVEDSKSVFSFESQT